MKKNTTKKNIKGKSTKYIKNKKGVKRKNNKLILALKNILNKIKNTFKKLINKIKFIIKETLKNTPLTVALCIIVVLIAVLIYALCIKRVPKTSNGNEIVATIEGKDVTVNELYEKLKESYGVDNLINLIDEYIAKDVEITEEDEEYAREVVDYYLEYAEYYETDLATFLSEYVGLSDIETEDEFFEFVLEDYKKTKAVQQYIINETTEDEFKKYYQQNYSDYLTVRHILVEIDSEAEDTEEATEDAYDKAMDLIEKLNDTKEEKLEEVFKTLAKENSDDTGSAEDGGLIEKFTFNDVVEEFWYASNELDDLEYTEEPIQSSYGYHVILKLNTTPVESYEEIKEDVKKAYVESLLSSDSTLYTLKWDALRKEYNLSIIDDYIKDLYNKTIEDAAIVEETE